MPNDDTAGRYYEPARKEHFFSAGARELEMNKPTLSKTWKFPFVPYDEDCDQWDEWEAEEVLTRPAAREAARKWIQKRWTAKIPVSKKVAYFLDQRFNAGSEFLDSLLVGARGSLPNTSLFKFRGSYEKLLDYVLCEWWESTGSWIQFSREWERFGARRQGTREQK